MFDNNESIMNQLSLAESLLNCCGKEENIFRAMNIITEAFQKLETLNDGGQMACNSLLKIFEVFPKVNNKTKLCLINIIKENKTPFIDNIFIKSSVQQLILKIISMTTCSDSISRRCLFELIKEFPFVMNLELLHSIYDLYFKNNSSMESEKKSISELFKTLINTNSEFKKSIEKFLERNSIRLI